MTTTVEAEVPYLKDVIACTSSRHDAVWLENKGTQVWKPTVQLRDGAQVQYVRHTWRAISFANALNTEYSYSLLTPETTLIVETSPQEVAWNLDIPLSLAWEAHDWVVDQIVSYSEEAAFAAMKRQSHRGAAIATCSLATYKAAVEAPNLQSASMSQLVVAGIGSAANVSACYSRWIEANQLDGQSYDWNRIERIRTTTTVLEKIDTHLTNAARLNRIISLVLGVK